MSPTRRKGLVGGAAFVALAALALVALAVGGTWSVHVYRPLTLPALTKPGPALADASAAFAVFDGVDDYVVVQNAASLDPTRALTLEVWVLPVSSTSFRDHVPILLKPSPTDAEPFLQYGLFIRDSPDDPRLLDFQLQLDGTRHSVSISNSGWRYDVWNHVVATYDGRRMRLYLNGGRIAEAPASGKIGTYETPLLLGRYLAREKFDLAFRGQLSDVAVYDGALTLSGAEEHYGLTPDDASYAARVRSEGAVGYWRFTGSQPSVSDASGRGNTATLAGGVALGRVPGRLAARPGVGH